MSRRPEGSAPASTSPVGPWLARALEAATQAQSLGTSEALAQAAMQAAASAMQAAFQAQARAWSQAQGRMMEGLPGGASGAEVSAATPEDRLPPDVAGGGARGWARLRRDSAQDLLEARREEVPEEYREVVDAYFRALAHERQNTTP